MTQVVEKWSAENPRAALEWWVRQDVDLEAGTLQRVLYSWIRREPDQAFDWIDEGLSQPAGTGARAPTRQEELEQAANSAAGGVGSEQGLRAVVRVRDPALRGRLLEPRAKTWLQLNRSAATRFIEETPHLSAEEKQQLLSLPESAEAR